MAAFAVDPRDLLAAAHFAAEKHRLHKRKDEDASPYINHPIQVAEVLARVGGVTERDVLLAALLHDTIEDTETTRQELEARFGAEVAALVAEVSDDKSLKKEERKQRQIEHAPSLSRGAVLIKLGDKICNVRDIAESPPKNWPLERRLEYFQWARDVITRCPRVNEALEREFDAVVARAEAHVRASG